jgi:hypothetical protein
LRTEWAVDVDDGGCKETACCPNSTTHWGAVVAEGGWSVEVDCATPCSCKHTSACCGLVVKELSLEAAAAAAAIGMTSHSPDSG